MGIDAIKYQTNVLRKEKALQDTNEFKDGVFSDINNTAEDAYNKMLAKKAEYEAAKNQLSIWTDKKTAAYTKYTAAQQANKNGYSSGFNQKRTEYENALSGYSGASIDVDVLRSSLQDCISYSGKMITSASVANSVLS